MIILPWTSVQNGRIIHHKAAWGLTVLCTVVEQEFTDHQGKTYVGFGWCNCFTGEVGTEATSLNEAKEQVTVSVKNYINRFIGV